MAWSSITRAGSLRAPWICSTASGLSDDWMSLTARSSILTRSGAWAGLEEISVQAAADAVLDLAVLPRLRSIAGTWPLIEPTLSAVTGLERAVTWMFADIDLHAFRDHVALKSLTIKDAPFMESLSGLGGLPDLAALTIVAAPRLHEINDVAELALSLRKLTFEECVRIEAIDDVEPLAGLRFLGISESGDIASLAPIETLAQLEAFYAWGSTRIVDGDLSPLARLSRLKEIRMRNRRSYRPPVSAPGENWTTCAG